MALGNTSASLDALLKELYSPDRVVNTIFSKNVLLGMLSKDEKQVGRNYDVPMIINAGQGRSNTFSVAQNNASKTGEQAVVFQIPMVENHAVANISTAVIQQTDDQRGGWVKAMALVMDNQLLNFANDVSFNIYTTSAGIRGTIDASTTIASGTIKLTKPSDALNFCRGMELDAVTSATASAPEAYGSAAHGLVVGSVDYVQGTLSILQDFNGSAATNLADGTYGIPTIAAGMGLVQRGDFKLKMFGMQDWLVYGGPTNTPFCGVDRTLNPTFLAGHWMDGTTTGGLVPTLELAIAQVAATGGEVDTFMVSHRKFAKLAIEIGSKVQLSERQSTASQGYTGIQVVGATGPCVVLPDRTCPEDRVFGLNMSTWTLRSSKKAIRIYDDDGLTWLRSTNQSGMEARWYSRANLHCSDPRQNIVIKVAA